MKVTEIFFVILLSVLSYSFVCSEELKPTERTLFQRFSKIQGFGPIQVELTQNKYIGLSENELTDYVKLKFRNNFKGIQILTMDQAAKIPAKGRGEKLGYIWFSVFTVGDTDYPVAYHVQCRAGNLKYLLNINNPLAPIHRNSIIWEESFLGVNKKRIFGTFN